MWDEDGKTTMKRENEKGRRRREGITTTKTNDDKDESRPGDGESEAVTTGQIITSKGRAAGAQAKEISPPRVIIEAVEPEIDHGRFPIKRTVGEEVVVSADAFAEGHDL